MSDRFATRLSEYLDGELSGAERRKIENHLEGCAGCRQALDALRRVVARLDTAPDTGPTRDLWPGIATQIDAAADAEVSTPPRHRPWWPQLAAAAALLAVIPALALWLMARDPGGRPAAGPIAGALEDGAGSGTAVIEPYRLMVSQWREVVDASVLPAPLTASIHADLEAYDRAMAEAQAALTEAPEDQELTAYMIDTLKAQARLLSRVTMTAEAL